MVYDAIYMKCPEQISPQGQRTDGWLPKEGRRRWGAIMHMKPLNTAATTQQALTEKYSVLRDGSMQVASG